MKSKNVDFTTGNICINLLKFALPIMMGELLQNLYHSTDSLVLGNFAGKEALAAVSVCSTLVNMLSGFCNGMSVGGTIVVSKACGAGDKEKLQKSILYSYTFSVILGIVISCAGYFISPFLVRISNANEEIYSGVLLYLRIYLCGLVFTVIYNNSAGILRGIGDMRTPFYTLLVSCSINIGLDLLFCAFLGLGIAGVAIATVISQFISVSISFYVINTKLGYRCFSLKETFKNGWSTIYEVFDIGFAAGSQAAILSFSNLFVWRYINRFSTSVVAGVGVGHRVDKFVSLPLTAFGNSITTFTGQNIGAGKTERIKKGVRTSILLSISFCAILGIIVYTNAGFVASIYNNEPEVIETAVNMMHILIPFYSFSAIRQVLMGVLRANKRSRMTMILTLAGMVGVRQIYLAVAMRINSCIRTVYFCYPIGWFASFLFILIYYLCIET